VITFSRARGAAKLRTVIGNQQQHDERALDMAGVAAGLAAAPAPAVGVQRSSIADLRRGQPDATLKNLLRILNAKLDLCASLPVFEWEARDEGHEECAAAIRRLADAERRLCADVMLRLQYHLDAGMPS
jgi:hypothetical protein